MRHNDQTTTMTPLVSCRGTGDDDPQGGEDHAEDATLPEPLASLQGPSREGYRRFYEF